MLNELQKKTAQAIINIFETGRVQGNYGAVTLLKDDPGHLTYGRSQTTLASGNLHLLIKSYCAEPGAQFATELTDYLDPLAHRDTILDHDMDFRALLAQAGEDPIMRDVQDRFFDRVYWLPSASAADKLKIASALGCAVVYDGFVHGSWAKMRDRTNAALQAATNPSADAWIEHYVEERRQWLAASANALLRKTVYRMETFQTLIAGAHWDLDLPLKVRGVEVTEASLLAHVTVRASAHDIDFERTLRLEQPRMRGTDVEALQKALSGKSFRVDADGIFGQETADAVMRFQKRQELTVDGIVGPATRSALGLS